MILAPPSLAAEEPGSPSGEEVQDERTAADSTTQRILNIMAEFLEGEVGLVNGTYSKHVLHCVCVCIMSTRWLWD